MWSAGFKWMFLILGTIIGAGYASGRELWQFFGFESGLAILLFTIFFSFACYTIMKISYKEKSEHFFPVLERLVGTKLSYVYDVLIIVYLFTTTVVMIAGGGATLEVFSVPYWMGIIVFCLMLAGLFFWDVDGVFSLNSFLIPILIIGLLVALMSFQFQHPHAWILNMEKQYNWPSALTFTSLNILPLVAVLSAIGKEIKSIKEAKIASIGSGCILGGISLLYNETLVQLADYIGDYEIPLFAILEGSPVIAIVFMSFVLWLAIYTTAVSGIFGLATRFRKIVNIPIWLMASIFVLLMIPFTSLGFSALISFLYPLYGLINLYLLVAILLFPLTNRYKWD
ncbi:YkvI family membrane protein [Metabacillus arenae]|uniref:Membrane protein YkvI n=1 Tax=Metabacillus arenae TaxID=2771434 RepID=A0A926RWR6_9BACI|nr:hypothetical protein [Metabacillus arenae]MBD1379850.1 hypothetical protein [Metabacillus arenae]